MARGRRQLWIRVVGLAIVAIGAWIAYRVVRSPTQPGPNYSLSASARCFRSRSYRVTRTYRTEGYPTISVFAPGFSDGGLPLVFTSSRVAAERVTTVVFGGDLDIATSPRRN